MMKPFFKFFAERHILANLITIMIVLLGINSLMKMKRDSYPIVDYGMMTIVTTYPGASPEDVELNVTNKIEKELKSVTGIKRFTSVSMENNSLITVIIDEDVRDQKKVKNDVRDAVDRVTDFPPEVEDAPLVTEINSAQIPVLEVGISGNVPYRELREYARLFEKKLELLPGVSHTEKYGYRDREILVEVHPQRIDEYKAPLSEIITAIKKRNIRSTAGSFESFTSEKNLVTLAQFENPLEVSDVIVRTTYDGPRVKVKNLAIVKDDFEEEKILSRINGVRAISFVVYKTEAGDVIRVAEAVKKLVNETNKNLPEGLKFSIAADFSRYVKNRFSVVTSNAAIGLVLVILVLILFLNWRSAFWVAMGIPIAVLGTIFLMPFFGAFLDSLTLSAMIMVMGIIVDDAIIISENIYHHRELGKSPLDAVVDGINEVFSPVVTTVLTTFLAFAPMFFMSGLFGKFIFVIPLVITIALFISLIEGTIALPAHLMPGLSRIEKNCSACNWFIPVQNFYQKIIPFFLKFRSYIIGGFFIVLICSGLYAVKFMKVVLFPSTMAEEFYIIVELEKGASLQMTSRKVKEIENMLLKLPKNELDSFITRIGQGVDMNTGGAGMQSENRAILDVSLTPLTKRTRTAEEIVESFRKATKNLSGHENISFYIETGGPPVGKPVSLQIVGSDDKKRNELADAVVVFLQSIKGVKDIDRNDKLGKDQIEIKINYDRLSQLGLTVADIAQYARIAYDGEIVTSVRYGEEDVDFRVILDEKARKDENFLNKLLIPNKNGKLIALSETAQFISKPGYANFQHYEGERTITISADVLKDVVVPLEVMNAVYKHFDLDHDWPGMRFIKAGEAFETEKSIESLIRTFFIALIGMYFLLIILFNSLIQPLLVLMAVPFGIIGVIIAFALHGEPLSFMGMLGSIGLAGVVVNDSLVLVSHLNALRRKNPNASILDIVTEGSTHRLRAIIMTTLTTVVGLLPLAYGLGGTDPFIAPMALALGYGLVFATPLTLVLVPCLYVVGFDIGKVLKKFNLI